MSRRVLTSQDLQRIGTRGEARGIKTPDDALTRIMKYIPAEIVALYLMVMSILDAAADAGEPAYWIVFGGALAMNVTFLALSTSIPGLLGPSWGQVLIASLAFVLWAMALGGPFQFVDMQSWIAPVGIVFFSVGVPLLMGQLPGERNTRKAADAS